MAGMKPTEWDKRLGERLQAARAERNVTQRALAAAIGVSAAQWQKYEQGTNRISASALQVCARVLQMPPGHFFDADPNVPATLPDALVPALQRTKRTLLQLIEDLHEGLPA